MTDSTLRAASGIRRALPAYLALVLAGCGAGDAERGGGETAADGPEELPIALVRPSLADAVAPDTFRARFETTEGAFTVRVVRSWAPRGADRLFNLVTVGFYTDVYVHRVVPGVVAQFGIHPDPRINYVWQQSVIQDDPVLRSNTRGSVAFAKGRANSRTAQVFVNLRDNPGFDDQGFAPVGIVEEGMDVVDALYAGYGDGPPRGAGPYPARAAAEGNDYFEREFPELDRILAAEIVP